MFQAIRFNHPGLIADNLIGADQPRLGSNRRQGIIDRGVAEFDRDAGSKPERTCIL